MRTRALQLVTYLAPSLPMELFELVGRRISEHVDCPVAVSSRIDRSGPLPGDDDPFANGEADIGFICAPSYVALRGSTQSVELAGVALVPADPRVAGQPEYFADVVVHRDHPARDLDDLRGDDIRWAANDPSSLSGYRSIVLALGHAPNFRFSGSHATSIDLIREGHVDAAAIDANAWATLARRATDLRIVASLGPHPMQPVVVRCDLHRDTRTIIRHALLDWSDTEALRGFGFLGFAAVNDDDYPESLNA